MIITIFTTTKFFQLRLYIRRLFLQLDTQYYYMSEKQKTAHLVSQVGGCLGFICDLFWMNYPRYALAASP